MKKKKVFYVLFLWGLFLLPFVNLAVAKPNYVGIDEGDSFIWRTEFNKGPYEDYWIDAGYSDSYAENLTDYLFDVWDIDTDVEGWKVVILEIKSEKDDVYKSDDIYWVDYLYNFYESEVGISDWDREESNERGDIIEYDEDLYLDNTLWSWGLLKWFLATDVNWRELANNLEDEMDYWNEEGEASAEYRNYFFSRIHCGISTTWNPEDTSETEDFESVARYTEDGVLMYYEWTYDGKTIWEIELDGRFLYENGWWLIPLIVIVIGLVIVPVTIVSIVMVRKKHRAKKEGVAPPKKEKKPEVPSPTAVTPAAVTPSLEPPLEAEAVFCPMCGAQVKGGKNFCQECGANLKE
ncbi:MAG: zinc ribbon domain-containing protein [Promethearchaeota archaeon]|nr:MAG: zinc ribbon domain-containing protein [Candidatus Lokiarchaeota archaeon]